MRRIYPTLVRLTLAAVMLVCLLTLLAWPLLTVQAGPNLPSRNTPTPVSPGGGGGGGDDKGDSGDKPLGAYIELHTQPPQAGLWAVVQWQDSAGQWQDVEGWQGMLDEQGHRRWWVAAKDFSRGPFRWQVYQSEGGPLLGASEPFDLPAGAGVVVQVTVMVK